MSVGEVDPEIDHHHGSGQHQVDGGDQVILPRAQGAQQQTAYAGQDEDLLDDDRPSDEDGQLKADDGDHRDEGILQGMPHHDYPLLQPLRPGRPDVVLAQHLQRHGARHAHRGTRKGHPQDRGREEKHSQIAQRVLGEGDQFQRR